MQASSNKWKDLEDGRDHPRTNGKISKMGATILEQMERSRRWARPSSNKSKDLEEGREHPRTNGKISKMGATILEQMERSRRWARPSSNKWKDLEDGRDHPRTNGKISKMGAAILEQIERSRRWTQPSSSKSAASLINKESECTHREFSSDYPKGCFKYRARKYCCRTNCWRLFRLKLNCASTSASLQSTAISWSI